MVFSIFIAIPKIVFKGKCVYVSMDRNCEIVHKHTNLSNLEFGSIKSEAVKSRE